MALLPSVFKAEDHEAMSDFTPVPDNRYLSEIVKSEVKATKARTGKLLKMQEKILEGDYKGRLVFIQLNIENPNETAVEISFKELRSICDACGKGVVHDSQELHGIPHYITTRIEVDENGVYPDKNKIVKYEPTEDTLKNAGGPEFDDNDPLFDEDEEDETSGVDD